MAILGVTYTPPMSWQIGGADNYFPDPEGRNRVVSGGKTTACPSWFFGRSTGPCALPSGNPNTVISANKRCILRSLKIWGGTGGVVRVSQWDTTPVVVLEVPVTPEGSFIDFGDGIDVGDLPFVETTSIVQVEFVYDVS